MILTILFYIFGSILYVMTSILPKWSIYPQEILTAFSYFGTCLMKLNFLFPVYELLTLICYVITFEIGLFTIRKIISPIINLVRGGKVIDI